MSKTFTPNSNQSPIRRQRTEVIKGLVFVCGTILTMTLVVVSISETLRHEKTREACRLEIVHNAFRNGVDNPRMQLDCERRK